MRPEATSGNQLLPRANLLDGVAKQFTTGYAAVDGVYRGELGFAPADDLHPVPRGRLNVRGVGRRLCLASAACREEASGCGIRCRPTVFSCSNVHLCSGLLQVRPVARLSPCWFATALEHAASMTRRSPLGLFHATDSSSASRPSFALSRDRPCFSRVTARHASTIAASPRREYASP